MSTTLAQLNDRVYLELSVVHEFLQLGDIHNAVIQVHNILVAESRTSSINVLLGVSGSFTPAATQVDVTSYIGKGVPAFIEIQNEQGDWDPIRIVPAVQLSDYRQLGILAAAFYAEESSSASTDPIQYVEFSFIPGGACRIRFDRDSVRIGLVDSVLLPDHVVNLIVKRVQNMIIPRLKVAIDMRCRSDKDLRELAKDIKQSLTEIMAQNMMDIKPLQALWAQWAFKDRAGEAAFTKVTPSSRYAYGSAGMVGGQ